MAGALAVTDGRVAVDPSRAAATLHHRRALISVSDKAGLASFATRLAGIGFELVSTGGTARALREAGLAVTDVAQVTGFPEMLDGRVKTLHPRIAAGVLADLRSDEHREQLAAAAIEPFELVVVNLYPFAEAAARTDTSRRRADRADRHRRPDAGPRGGQEPRRAWASSLIRRNTTR